MKQTNLSLHKGTIRVTLAPLMQSRERISQNKSLRINNMKEHDQSPIEKPNLGAAAFIFLAAIVVLVTLGVAIVKFIF